MRPLSASSRSFQPPHGGKEFLAGLHHFLARPRDAAGLGHLHEDLELPQRPEPAGQEPFVSHFAALLEQEPDTPVIAINAATHWHALRQVGIEGFGSPLGTR